ncbi:MAG: hypothetical protein IPK82_40865 [Polyangiaceae bacterium]|nr:hypothetical protein [Polyangiaceae bacterium]
MLRPRRLPPLCGSHYRYASIAFALLLQACRQGSAEPAKPAPSASTVAASTSAVSTSSSAVSTPARSAPTAVASAIAKQPIFQASPSTVVSDLANNPPHPVSGKGAGFGGPIDVALDGEHLLRLGTAEIVEVTPNRGGSSVTFRVRFADGKKAAVKPEQTGHPSDPRAEIASYHADRLVGFGRTAPVIGRSFDAAALRSALVAGGADAAFIDRFDRLLVVRDGQVQAAMIAWHTAPLVEEEPDAPYLALLLSPNPPPPEDLQKLGERSDLIVFDFLVDNPDRYSGGNILRLGKGGPLIFLDQGAAFGKNRLELKITTADRLKKNCRFKAETVSALRKVGPNKPASDRLGAQLERSVARDPLPTVLTPPHIAAVDERVALLLKHVQSCAAQTKQPESL